MGCDIHMLTEVKLGKTWRAVRAKTGEFPATLQKALAADKYAWIRWDQELRSETVPARLGKKRLAVPICFLHPTREDDRPYDTWDLSLWGRNYPLFGFLCGVRTEIAKPICPDRRGIPQDASPAMRAWSTGYGVDGHSHNYATLTEIRAADFDQVFYKGNMQLELAAYASWKAAGSPMRGDGPDEFYASAQDQQRAEYRYYAQKITPAAADVLLAREPDVARVVEALTGEQPFVVVPDYEYVLRGHVELFARFIAEVLEPLCALVGGDPERVRICFFFDN